MENDTDLDTNNPDDNVCHYMLDRLCARYNGRWRRFFVATLFGLICGSLGFIVCLIRTPMLDQSATRDQDGILMLTVAFAMLLFVLPTSSYPEIITKIEMFIVTKQHMSDQDRVKHLHTLTSEFYRRMSD